MQNFTFLRWNTTVLKFEIFNEIKVHFYWILPHTPPHLHMLSLPKEIAITILNFKRIQVFDLNFNSNGKNFLWNLVACN